MTTMKYVRDADGAGCDPSLLFPPVPDELLECAP